MSESRKHMIRLVVVAGCLEGRILTQGQIQTLISEGRFRSGSEYQRHAIMGLPVMFLK